jgi:anti-sigma factor RsiW
VNVSCEAAALRLWDYVDGRLSAMSQAEVDEHLAVCSGCPRFVAFAQLMRDRLAQLAERDDTESTHDALRERLRATLADCVTTNAG